MRPLKSLSSLPVLVIVVCLIFAKWFVCSLKLTKILSNSSGKSGTFQFSPTELTDVTQPSQYKHKHIKIIILNFIDWGHHSCL